MQTRYLTLAAVLAAAPAFAHQDPGSDKVNDLVTLKTLDASTDQDDGGGESEYCIRIKARHGVNHSLIDTDQLVCADADWDDPSDETGKAWQDLSPKRLPLVGAGGYMGASLNVRLHLHECTPSEAWEIEMRLYEVDYSPAGELIRDLAKLIEEEGVATASALGISDPRIAVTTKLVGKVARLAGKWVDRIVNETTPLGRHPTVFHDGEADPNSTLDADEPQQAQHFKAQFSKTTFKVGSCALPRVRYFLNDTRRGRTAAGEPCLSNESSALCLNPGAASTAQFEGLRGVAGKIANLQPEFGTLSDDAGLTRMQSAFIGLTGELARIAAYAQVDAIAETAEATGLLLELEPTLAEADQAFAKAVDSANPELLVMAVENYQKVHDTLAPQTYGEAFQEAWLAQLKAGFGRARDLARTARDAGNDGAALGYLGEAVVTYRMLDDASRESVEPTILDLFGTAFADVADATPPEAAEELLGGL